MGINRRNFLKFASLAPLAAIPFSDQTEAEQFTGSLIKPKAISPGDTIGLIAPGFPIFDPKIFDEMIENLEAMGYKLKLGKHARDQYGYLAGKDEDRASDVMEMFADDEVDGIICIRGGWGCNRILPLLDYNFIRENPKFFMGFSDITSLHMAFQKYCGLITFHGPVGKSKWTAFTKNSFQNVAVSGEQEKYSLPKSSLHTFVINPGKSSGRLLGGNLTVLTSMIGSEYLPAFKDTILFLEEVGEDIYRVDRMLTQLKLAGILDEISGFIFGKCTDCDSGSNSLSINQVLDHHIKPLGIPAFFGAMISHEDDNATLPVGIKAEMDAEAMEFKLLESGVSL